MTDGEALGAAFETSFNPDNADVPDLTASGDAGDTGDARATERR